jgi:quercetin dioxygenase-like cupin family protein
MSSRSRILVPSFALCAIGVAVVLCVHAPSEADPPAAPSPAGGSVAKGQITPPLVQSFDKAEKIEYPWGWIRWLMSSKIDPQAEMTFGIVYVKPHQRNPMHVHPNCAEYLHMLAGSCEHLVGDTWVTLKPGDTVRIPAGVRHVARTLDQPMRAVIVYSSGDRQFELVEDDKPN